MRMLLAFALLATAIASPQRVEPIHLEAAPEAGFIEPSFEPLFIPQDVADAYAKDLELNPAIETVQFADQPEDFAQFEEWNVAGLDQVDQVPEPIRLVDSEVAEIPEASNVQFAEQPELVQPFVHPLAYAEVAAEEIADAPSKVQFAEQPEEIDQNFIHPLMYGAFDESDVAAEELPEAPVVQFVEQPGETAAEDLSEPINKQFVPEEIAAEEGPESPADIQIADEFDQFFAQLLADDTFNVVPAESILEAEVGDSPVQFVEVAENPENPAPINYQVPALEDDFQPQELPNPKFYDNDMVR